MNANDAEKISNKYKNEGLSVREIECRQKILKSTLYGLKHALCDDLMSYKDIDNLKKDGFKVYRELSNNRRVDDWWYQVCIEKASNKK